MQAETIKALNKCKDLYEAYRRAEAAHVREIHEIQRNGSDPLPDKYLESKPTMEFAADFQALVVSGALESK